MLFRSSFKNGVITLEYDSIYAFNKARLEREEYKKTVNEVFSEALNEKVAVKYIIKEDDSIEENKEQLLKQKLDGEIPFEVYDE